MGGPPIVFDEGEFRRLWHAGLSTREIATALGISSSSTVSTIAKRIGVPRRPKGRPLGVAGHKPVTAAHALKGGEWRPNGRGVMVWERAS